MTTAPLYYYPRTNTDEHVKLGRWRFCADEYDIRASSKQEMLLKLAAIGWRVLPVPPEKFPYDWYEYWTVKD